MQFDVWHKQGEKEWEQTLNFGSLVFNPETTEISFDWSFSYGIPGRAENLLPAMLPEGIAPLVQNDDAIYYSWQDKGGRNFLALVPVDREAEAVVIDVNETTTDDVSEAYIQRHEAEIESSAAESEKKIEEIFTKKTVLVACVAFIAAMSAKRALWGDKK